MNLPPRLPAPAFVPELGDVVVIAAAARRRRARQSGLAATAVAAVFVALTVLHGDGRTGLSQDRRQPVAPVAPGPSSSTAAPPPAVRAAGPAVSATPVAPAGVSAAPGQPPPSDRRSAAVSSAGPAEAPPVAVPVPTGPALRAKHAIVPDRPGVRCQATATGQSYGGDGVVADNELCARWWWAPRIRFTHGETFSMELCALTKDIERMRYDSPMLFVDGVGHEWSWHEIERIEHTLAVGTCVRWTMRWDGSGHPVGKTSPRRYLPRGLYEVLVSWSAPTPGASVTPRWSSWSMHYNDDVRQPLRIV